MQDGEGFGRLLMQVVQVMGGEVGLRSVFAVAPTLLDGIQFRAIGRKWLEAEPGRMFDGKILGRFEMGSKVVPDEYDPISETIVQVGQERNQQRRIDVGVMELEREIHTMANGRNRKRADRRDSITSGGLDQDGRVARRSPGAANGRLEHEARFVQEYYGLLPASRPFFIRGHSTVRQCSRASGSCCLTRRSGFCGVKSS